MTLPLTTGEGVTLGQHEIEVQVRYQGCKGNLCYLPREQSIPVTLTVHDVKGRCLRTLHRGDLARGTIHSLAWDGKTEAGRPVASGLYFARAKMGEQVFSEKMLLLK